MAVQTYLIQLKTQREGDADARDALADAIAGIGGFILMATSAGSIIAAFDDASKARISADPAVALCSGVTLNPRGAAAEKLKHLFARNVAAQLATRGAPAPRAAEEPSFPPGYRPLRWQQRFS